jgi:hypothetical protein
MEASPITARRRVPKLAALVLSTDERGALERWSRRRSSVQALALRCRIVLACAGGASNTEVQIDPVALPFDLVGLVLAGFLVLPGLMVEVPQDLGEAEAGLPYGICRLGCADAIRGGQSRHRQGPAPAGATIWLGGAGRAGVHRRAGPGHAAADPLALLGQVAWQR